MPNTVYEDTSELPVQVGTVYTLKDECGKISKYTVTAIKENELFELVSEDNNYHARYVYRPIDENATGFEYYEWVDHGQLEVPFTMEILQKLKGILEASSL